MSDEQLTHEQKVEAAVELLYGDRTVVTGPGVVDADPDFEAIEESHGAETAAAVRKKVEHGYSSLDDQEKETYLAYLEEATGRNEYTKESPPIGGTA